MSDTEDRPPAGACKAALGDAEYDLLVALGEARLEELRAAGELADAAPVDGHDLDALLHDLLQEGQRLRELTQQHQQHQQAQAELDASLVEMRCEHRVGWEQSGNPIFVWGQVLHSRKGEPLPDWVHDYLHGVAASIIDAAADREVTPTAAAARLPGMLGMTRHGWNAFAAVWEFEDRIAAAAEFFSIAGKRERAAAADRLWRSPAARFRQIREAKDHARAVEEAKSKLLSLGRAIK